MQNINDQIRDQLERFPRGRTADEIAREIGVPTHVVQQRCSKMYALGQIRRLKEKRLVYKTVAKHHMVYTRASS